MPDHDEKGKIILRMDRSRTSRAFREGESLWEDEIFRILRLIKKHSKTLGNLPADTGIDQMPLLSIGIFGSPGSGKSSLLRTLVSWFHFGRNESDSKYKQKYPGIYSLPVIKPNLVAKDDHFLYAFLAAALKEDRDINKGKSTDYQGPPILSPLQQAFQEVSEYLQVINEVEKTLENDPLGMSLERLERHESGLVLIERMKNFIDKLVSIYTGISNASVVLLPVDDVDMEMETLVSVLDTYRRFLQHPRLVPVFTFTGRLAEELLRVHFENKLTVDGRFGSVEKLKEAATSLLLTENMAIQYLGRLFPVRNRIRLGPASARVLKAQYIPISSGSDDSHGQGKPVLKLLELVSHLLYGHVDPNFTPGIRAPLRMLTLRRQLQIVDAMQDANIDEFIKKETNEIQEDRSLTSWAQAFDFATWTLLNAHRDILKEINMNLDDLYAWTPQGLRHVVLRSILDLEPQRRQSLLRRWLYRTEDRRSQIISLLAANMFRPRMPGEESTGDDFDIINWLFDQPAEKKKSKDFPEKKNDEGSHENKGNETFEKMKVELINRSFPVDHGVIWFLDLCIGFYLPQILASCKSSKSGEFKDSQKLNKGLVDDEESKKEAHSAVISSVGWNLVNGPGLAVREALNIKRAFSNGMLFLETGQVEEIIKGKGKRKRTGSEKKEKEKNIKLSIFLHTWCFYGYDDGKSWLAVSLWRGLGLVGKLLRLYNYHNTPDNQLKLKECIESLLHKHFESAMILGRLPTGKSDQYVSIIKKLDVEGNIEKELITDFSTKLIQWLEDCKAWNPGTGNENTGTTGNGKKEETKTSKIEKLKRNRIFPLVIDEKENKEQADWKNCFIRRIHGESILSEFFKELDNTYFTYFDRNTSSKESQQTNSFEWDILAILERWVDVLKRYWKKEGKSETADNCRNILDLIMTCPILNCLIKDDEDNKYSKNEFWEPPVLEDLKKITCPVVESDSTPETDGTPMEGE